MLSFYIEHPIRKSQGTYQQTLTAKYNRKIIDKVNFIRKTFVIDIIAWNTHSGQHLVINQIMPFHLKL